MQYLYCNHHIVSIVNIFLLILLLNFGMVSPSLAQEKASIFEVMRMEFANDPASAIKKHFNKTAMKEWDSTVGDVLSISDVKYFFSFSGIELLDHTDNSVDTIYFNPWIDGVVLMNWKREKSIWKVNNFAFICGELLRDEIVDEKSVLPKWLRLPDSLVANMGSYYNETNVAILRNKNKLINDYSSNKSNAEKSLSLIAIVSRFNTRMVSAQSIFGSDASKRKNIQGMLEGMKAALKSKDKEKIRATFKTNNLDLIEAVALLPEPVISSFVGNWFVEKQGRLLVLMSSFVSPRLFIVIESNASGEVEWGAMGDWVSLSKGGGGTLLKN